MFGTNTMNREPEYQIDRKIKIYNLSEAFHRNHQ